MLRRMRRESAKQVGHRDTWDTGEVLAELPSGGPIDLAGLFGNARPVECEIGCGKGTFILARAAARPEVNLLGIEYARSYCRYTADRVRRQRERLAAAVHDPRRTPAGTHEAYEHATRNAHEHATHDARKHADDTALPPAASVRMVCADAADVVARLPAGSLIRMHIYFPDPWPKRRHHRRRLIQPPFVQTLQRVLRPGGELLVVTDHLGYFKHIRRVLTDVPGLARIAFPRMTDADGECVGTNFERKYITQGRAFYSLARLRYTIACGRPVRR
ncbi:MAG: tRNA (guanine(46)-N(7))-methyltransferase TrmB [Phycisphaerae bacterium]|nr:tRNA (guanine(46)-N(7))-methyltransferase TrmB [Phycisphaerae bacterium]